MQINLLDQEELIYGDDFFIDMGTGTGEAGHYFMYQFPHFQNMVSWLGG